MFFVAMYVCNDIVAQTGFFSPDKYCQYRGGSREGASLPPSQPSVWKYRTNVPTQAAQFTVQLHANLCSLHKLL